MEPESPDRAALLEALAQTYDPSRLRVLLVADSNHYRALETTQFTLQMAKALGSKGVSAVALEFLPAHDQRLYDALYNGSLSRPAFMEIVSTHSNSGQIKPEEQHQIYAALADTLESGIRVYGLNTRMYAPENPKLDSAINDYMARQMEITLNLKMFEQAHSAELEKDPETLFLKRQREPHLSAESQERTTALQDRLTDDLAHLPAAVTPEGRRTLFRQAVIDLVASQHPLADIQSAQSGIFMEWLAYQKTATPAASQKARLSADTELANHIEQILTTERGLVVQYGVGHTLTQLQGLFPDRAPGDDDLDGALRKKGIGVMIIDPSYGAETRLCPPQMDDSTCIHWPAALDKIHDATSADKDPDRYSIPDIKKNQIKGPLH